MKDKLVTINKGNPYRILVKGILDPKWADWFNGMSIEPVGDYATLLIGPVTDQAALHGILSKIRDLGLVLLRVQLLEGREDMGEFHFTTHTSDDSQDFAATAKDEMILVEGLGQNILKRLGKVELGKSIRIFLRDQKDRVVGGICAGMFGGWLYISLLWVEENLRNQGYGSELLKRLETEATRLGCQHAHVDTYDFEARPFYERAGYEVFAILEDYPLGHRKYFLKKALVSDEK